MVSSEAAMAISVAVLLGVFGFIVIVISGLWAKDMIMLRNDLKRLREENSSGATPASQIGRAGYFRQMARRELRGLNKIDGKVPPKYRVKRQDGEPKLGSKYKVKRQDGEPKLGSKYKVKRQDGVPKIESKYRVKRQDNPSKSPDDGPTETKTRATHKDFNLNNMEKDKEFNPFFTKVDCQLSAACISIGACCIQFVFAVFVLMQGLVGNHAKLIRVAIAFICLMFTAAVVLKTIPDVNGKIRAGSNLKAMSWLFVVFIICNCFVYMGACVCICIISMDPNRPPPPSKASNKKDRMDGP